MVDRKGAARRPPVAPTRPVTTTLHGNTRVDEYAWLRDKANPKVMEHLRAEGAYASRWMEPTEPLQKALYDEMLARIQETDVSVPYRKGGHWYYVRTEEGKQYPILCRKAGTLDAVEQVTLDMNAMAEGLPFLALGEYDVSDDGNLLLFSTDTTGYREYTLQRKDLRTGEIDAWRVERVSTAAWATVAGPKLDQPVGFARRTVRDIRFAKGIHLQLRHGRAAFLNDRLFPILELFQEIGPLLNAHKFSSSEGR